MHRSLPNHIWLHTQTVKAFNEHALALAMLQDAEVPWHEANSRNNSHSPQITLQAAGSGIR